LFASLSSDWTIRLHSTMSSELGNRDVLKRKAKVESLVGGVGGESIVFTGWSMMPRVINEDGADADGTGDEEEESENEVWDGMEELDDGEAEENEDSDRDE
jgi:hypothetical protein